MSLRSEMRSQIESLNDLAPVLEHTSYSRIGSALVVSKTPLESKATSLLLGYKFRLPNRAFPLTPLPGRVPRTRGRIRTVGLGDLLIIKQQLKGYEAADVAHIENVLRGESKGREITSTTRQESTSLIETETSTSEENELSSTSRFEMSKESSNTLKEDQALKAGLQITAKYGPCVEVSASVEGSVSRSREAVNKAASRVSHESPSR